MFNVTKKIIISKKEFTKTSYKGLQVYIENNLIDSESSMCLISFFDRNERHNNQFQYIPCRKVNVKPYGFDKMFMNKDLIEDNFYQIIDRFNEKIL